VKIDSFHKLIYAFSEIDFSWMSSSLTVWLLVDVDHTLITPSDALFAWNQGKNPDFSFMDNLKKSNHPHLKTIVSRWRLTRPIRLMEEGLPAFLETQKQRGIRVMALTKMDVGQHGDIADMGAWRRDELRGLGFSFTPLLGPGSKSLGDGEYVDGILMTGTEGSKKETLEAFDKLAPEKPDVIVFVDDRISCIEEVAAYAAQKGIAYHGYLYRRIETFEAVIDSKVSLYQKNLLKTEHRWEKDDVAKKNLKD